MKKQENKMMNFPPEFITAVKCKCRVISTESFWHFHQKNSFLLFHNATKLSSNQAEKLFP
jgi:hypothetical protein